MLEDFTESYQKCNQNLEILLQYEKERSNSLETIKGTKEDLEDRM